MNICIIEDEKQQQELLRNHIMLWQKESLCLTDIHIYSDDQILSDPDYLAYHIIFMDIQLDHCNGISLAQTLREKGYQGDLVFFTAFKEYVFEGYHVHALNYLLKPVSYECMKDCLNYTCNRISPQYYIYRYRNTIQKIPFSQIIMFSSNNHQTEIVTITESYQQPQTLKSIFHHLPGQFYQCHRTVVLNIQHVLKITQKEAFLTNGITVPVSASYLDSIRTAFIQQIM